MLKHLRIILLFFPFLSANAQIRDTTFKKEWTSINYLITEKKLPKSALVKLDELYKKAKEKKLSMQTIKALIYKLSIQQDIEETSIQNTIKFWQMELSSTNDKTAKAIIQLMLAKAYFNEYSNDYWKYKNRTETKDYKPVDIETWTKNNFAVTIDSLLQAMLKQATVLQQVKLKEIDAIIIEGEEENLRPTLYDLLAFEAIDCYTEFMSHDNEQDWMVSSIAFTPNNEFINEHFIKDSTGFVSQVLQVFQAILKFHQNDKDKAAFIDVDIQRIAWARNHSHLTKKEELYVTSLQQIINAFGNLPAADEAWFLLAVAHKEKANDYKPNEDTANRFEKVKALEIIDKRLQQQTKVSSGRYKLKELKNEILVKNISSKVESINVPNQPFRVFVEYTNTDTLYYRIIKISKDFTMESDDKYWPKLAKLPSIRKGFQQLPATNDHQQHGVELKMDELPIGFYMILASTGKNFMDSTDRLFAQHLQVSSLSYIQREKDYFILDRETGQPIQQGIIRATARSWDGTKYNQKFLGEASTNKNGFASLAKIIGKNDSYYNIVLIKGNDTLSLGEKYSYNHSSSNEKYSSAKDFEKKNAMAFFFTDRSIYRPGQTTHFKALLTSKDSATGKNKLYLGKKKMTAQLFDANNNLLDSSKLTVNDFGSVNGLFKLPLNGLTGNYSINFKEINGSCNFSVEEYKRPAFFVEINNQTSTYKINDSIKVTGFVKAYAGNTLNNAKVSYTVNRNKRFIPYWGWGRKTISYNYDNDKQISQGSLTTDENGKFELTFKAIPDDATKKDSSIVYDYSVAITATDLNGETREENTSISIGFKSLLLETAIAETNETNSFKKFSIEAKNLSDVKVATQVQVKIFQLQTPTSPIRSRYWSAADQFTMNEAEYKKQFPYDEYKNEADHTTWKKLQLVMEGSMVTKRDSFFILNKPLPQGWYAIEMVAKDSLGNEVTKTDYTEVFDANAATLPSPSFNWDEKEKVVGQVADTASILIGSSLQDVFVIGHIRRREGNDYSRQTEENNYEFFQLNRNKKAWQQTITETDRKGLGMFYAFVKHNRFYEGGSNITVPQENKELQVEYSTYRNKTEPGSKETWSIKVKGNKNEKVAAELVTAMYDVSLDQYRNHDWYEPNIWGSPYPFSNNWEARDCFKEASSNENNGKYFYYDDNYKYNKLAENGSDLWWRSFDTSKFSLRPTRFSGSALYGLKLGRKMEVRGAYDLSYGYSAGMAKGAIGNVSFMSATADSSKVEFVKFTPPQIVQDELFINAERLNKPNQPKVQPRKNFSETAFFFPNLYADTAGNYTFSFTIPESLTQWKWLSFAHTKDLAFGTNSASITTQKTLMVQPNATRFMREGDNMEFVTKVSNLSDKELTGQATLELVDAVTGTSVDGWFQNIFPTQYFTVAAGQSAAVKFPIQVPFSYNKPLTWRVVARAGEFSDGEENTLPVLTNRMLVTETLPLYLKPGEKEKAFTFDKLLNNKSESLTHESVTVEYTANPIWSVVQSLPYLLEYPYECAEQTFNRFYANALAASIVNKHPNIKSMFGKWKNDTALKSNLQKNEELKQVLLQETPWVLNAESEEQQKKNIALLFDVVKMGNSMESVIEKLKQMQLESGGFAWFKGGREDRYITNYILTGIGKLKKINAISKEVDDKLIPIITRALRYLDTRIEDDYNRLVKNKVDLKKDNLSSTAIQYLYMKSFYTDVKVNEGITTAKNYYYNQAKQYWNKQNSYNTAMIGLVLYRNNERRFVNVNILPSITENAVEDTTKGTVYWKERNTCFWYASPIEHQSMMIEFLGEVQKQDNFVGLLEKVDAAKTWLILNKQTNNWRTTVATADACYALLNTGSNWTQISPRISINVGDKRISNPTVTEVLNRERNSVEGNIKERIAGNEIKSEMGNIKVTVDYSYRTPSYGSIYWQYFEDLDKITEASSPLSIKKKLFIERNTDKGKILELVSDTNQLKVGDKLIVRMELRSDREMEYLHLKDMRASGTEPVNVLSGYKWQEGLGYYEATKDASTNFFIDKMQKGTYVFEYPLFVTHTGTFSVGIATIQCMYAPEFTSHSEGIKINVK